MTRARPTTRALPAMAVEMPPPGTKAGATGWTRNPKDKRRGATSDRIGNEGYKGDGGGDEADQTHTVCADSPRSRRRPSVWWGPANGSGRRMQARPDARPAIGQPAGAPSGQPTCQLGRRRARHPGRTIVAADHRLAGPPRPTPGSASGAALARGAGAA